MAKFSDTKKMINQDMQKKVKEAGSKLKEAGKEAGSKLKEAGKEAGSKLKEACNNGVDAIKRRRQSFNKQASPDENHLAENDNQDIPKLLRQTKKQFISINVEHGVRRFLKMKNNSWYEIQGLKGYQAAGVTCAATLFLGSKVNHIKNDQQSTFTDKLIKLIINDPHAHNKKEAKIESDFSSQIDADDEVVDIVGEAEISKAIVMDNTWKSLNHLLCTDSAASDGSPPDYASPHHPSDITFYQRAVMASDITNSVIGLLEDYVIYTKINLENILYRELSNKSYQTMLKIPCKQASLVVNGHSLASVLGYIFGAKDIYKNRTLKCANLIKQGIDSDTANAQASQEPLNSDGLCVGFADINIDDKFKFDLLELLKGLSTSDTELRLDLTFCAKFLKHIPFRIKHYQAYNNSMQNLIILEKEYKKLANQVGLSKSKVEKKLQVKNIEKNMAKKDISPYFLEIKDIVKSNDSVEEITNLFPNTAGITAELTKGINALQISIANFNELSQMLSNNTEKFLKTNSSGIKKIDFIMSSEKSSRVDKLLKLQKLGKDKTTGIFATYSRSSRFFGKGRHGNIEKLYQKLANLDIAEIKKGNFKSVSSITEYINKTSSFVHKRGDAKKSRCRPKASPTARAF